VKVSGLLNFGGVGPKGGIEVGVRIFSLLVYTWVWRCRVSVPFCTYYSLTSC
jgi:hypothetical protein